MSLRLLKEKSAVPGGGRLLRYQSGAVSLLPAKNQMKDTKFAPAPQKVIQIEGEPLEAGTSKSKESRFSHDFSKIGLLKEESVQMPAKSNAPPISQQSAKEALKEPISSAIRSDSGPTSASAIPESTSEQSSESPSTSPASEPAMQEETPASTPLVQASAAGFKSVTNADGKGWLLVRHSNGSIYPPLPQYLRVKHTGTSGGRENFTIKESGRNGSLIGKTASVKQKGAGDSYLSSSMAYKGSATVEFDKGKKELRYGTAGPVAAYTLSSNPVPDGTHDLEIPYEKHPIASRYESSSKYAQTWFRLGHSGDRFLHPGTVSAGCVTVTAVSEWTKIYDYLINSRKDNKNVGQITVK